MSRFDKSAPRGASVLIAQGDPGVEIQIVSPDYRVLVSGTGEVKADLPEGIYMVNWVAGGQTTQRVVRLLPLPEPLIVRPNASPTQGSAEDLTSSSKSEEQVFVKTLNEMTKPAHLDHESEVAIIIRAQSLEQKIDLSVGLRLLDHDEVAMKSDGRDAAELQHQTSDGYACRLYHVEPGAYRLRYLSMSGEILDQTVPAIKGRRTVIMMSAGVGKVMMPEGDRYRAVDYQGVDPARTVVVSTPRAAHAAQLAEVSRLAEILLHDLAFSGGSLGAAFAIELDATDADPLLRLYAAAVVISRTDQRTSPALDEPWPSTVSDQQAFCTRWRGRAAQWLSGILQEGSPPDVTALLWRLQGLGETLKVKTPALVSPPMLECAWAWAVAHSTQEPESMPTGLSFRAAGRSGGGTAPWLTWRAALAKGDQVGLDRPSADDLATTIEAVAAKVREIVKVDETTREPNQSSDALAFLSQDSKAMAVRAFEVTEREAVQQAAIQGLTPAMELATLFGSPAPELKSQLLQTLAELNAASGQKDAKSSEAEARDPPGLMRPVLHPDDSNKGRFGSKAKRARLVLSVQFKATRNEEWVRSELIVEDQGGEIQDGDKVEFILHDSFRPNRVSAIFKKGRARQTVTSWGGFTVGAWIASRKVELELDLAEVEDAPAIIRDR